MDEDGTALKYSTSGIPERRCLAAGCLEVRTWRDGETLMQILSGEGGRQIRVTYTLKPDRQLVVEIHAESGRVRRMLSRRVYREL